MPDPFVFSVVAIIQRNEHVLAMRRSLHKDAGPGLWETISGDISAARVIRDV